MARAQCLIPIDGALIMVSEVTGKRYQFTRREWELPIDDCDVRQFDAKTIKTSKCGCRGGQGVRDQIIKVFQIMD